MITDLHRFIIFCVMVFVTTYLVSYISLIIGGFYLLIPSIVLYFYFGVNEKIQKFCYGDEK